MKKFTAIIFSLISTGILSLPSWSCSSINLGQSDHVYYGQCKVEYPSLSSFTDHSDGSDGESKDSLAGITLHRTTSGGQQWKYELTETYRIGLPQVDTFIAPGFSVANYPATNPNEKRNTTASCYSTLLSLTREYFVLGGGNPQLISTDRQTIEATKNFIIITYYLAPNDQNPIRKVTCRAK